MVNHNLRPKPLDLKPAGHMYDVLGKNIVLQDKLLHPVKRFVRADEFYRKITTWERRWYIHECVRDLNGSFIDIYYEIIH
jgi:hypothetical protein